MKKVIYVAGPYRSTGDDGVFKNIIHARSMSRLLWKKGWAVICPHLNTAFMDDRDIDWRVFLDGDLELIARSDALFMLPGWEESEGSNIEYRKAIELGMPIYYDIEEVPNEQA